MHIIRCCFAFFYLYTWGTEMIGKTIAHYKILEKLGEGGMGVVYKAEDTRLGRMVALKFLPPNLTRDPDAKQRFIQEARAASSLQHDNICNIHDIDETPDVQLFIVMDYYEGETLKDAIGKGPLPIDRIIDIAVQIAAGLKEAHEKGIVHRDIKPANIMITEKGQFKIMDFGLAKLKGQSIVTKTGTMLGTAPYMSPEQTRGEKVDHRTDIWSFGVVVYEMIIGKLPFGGDYEQAMVYSILNEKPEPPTGLRTGVPMELERIIDKCLEKKAGDRYQHMDELIVDLRKVSPRITTQVSKPKRRIKPLWAVLPVVLLTLIGLYLLLPLKWGIDGESIAVLPFQNFSADGQYAYFAGGLHDELLTQLSKVAALKVISRTSVMGYASTTKSLKQIASELGVGRVVEASVQVSGERLRVNVQLIDAATDELLWAERYDRTLDDAFAIQSDVAQQIVAAVGVALSSTEKHGMTAVPTANAEAYNLYLQGLEYYNRPGYLRQSYEIAQKLFERALALDPGFALAHAELSRVHGTMYWFGWDLSSGRAALQSKEAETALRIAPDLPQARIAMGRVYYFQHRNYQRALKEFTIAIKRLPNDAELWATIGYTHRGLGNWGEAIDAFEKATQFNPRDANLYYDLGAGTFRMMHRYSESVIALNRALSLAPDLSCAANDKGLIYVFWQGQCDTLRKTLRRFSMDEELGLCGTVADNYMIIYYLERKPDSLLQLLRMTRETVLKTQNGFLTFSLYTARAHVLRGDSSAAAAAFDSARVFLADKLRELPDNWRVHGYYGLIMAGLKRRDEALGEARWLQQSKTYHEDAHIGPDLALLRAEILAQIGESNAAMNEIESLLVKPSELSVNLLRLEPIWDPIREHPRFKEILAKYAQK